MFGIVLVLDTETCQTPRHVRHRTHLKLKVSCYIGSDLGTPKCSIFFLGTKCSILISRTSIIKLPVNKYSWLFFAVICICYIFTIPELCHLLIMITVNKCLETPRSDQTLCSVHGCKVIDGEHNLCSSDLRCVQCQTCQCLTRLWFYHFLKLLSLTLCQYQCRVRVCVIDS